MDITRMRGARWMVPLIIYEELLCCLRLRVQFEDVVCT